jgi:hypothetical protein
MTDLELIDTRIYGASEDVRAAAGKLYEIYEALEELSSLFKSKLRTNFYAWDGDAAHSYDDAAVSMGAKVQTFRDRFYSAYQSLRAYAQQLDYHYRDMETVRTKAESVGLGIINKYDILAPKPLTTDAPDTCYVESPYGQSPSIDRPTGSLDGKYSLVQQHEVFNRLVQDVQDIRDDLEQWVLKNLRTVQEECATLIFARKVNSGMNNFLRDPWQFMPDAASTSWDAATRSYSSLVDTLGKSASEQQAFKMTPAAITEDGLGRFASASDETLSKMNKVGRGLSKAGTVIGVGTLGYEVVTSDTPAEKAVTGGLGLVAGTVIGGIVGDAVVGMAGGSVAGPLGVVAGGAAAVITGFTVGLTTEAHATTLYRQIPLEYRDRADAFVSHLPYYMFGASW